MYIEIAKSIPKLDRGPNLQKYSMNMHSDQQTGFRATTPVMVYYTNNEKIARFRVSKSTQNGWLFLYGWSEKRFPVFPTIWEGELPPKNIYNIYNI